MSAPVREFTAGSALFTRHDAHTRHLLDKFRLRLRTNTDATIRARAAAVATLVHPLADELRSIVDAEVQRRGLSDAVIADRLTIRGGTR